MIERRDEGELCRRVSIPRRQNRKPKVDAKHVAVELRKEDTKPGTGTLAQAGTFEVTVEHRSHVVEDG